MSFTPAYRPQPKVTGLTRAERKQAKRTTEAADERRCYRLVDARDGCCCRICRRLLSTSTSSMLDKVIRHHMVPRSRGVIHEPWNVVTVCRICEGFIHIRGTMRAEGNADTRDERGRLCGVKVSRLEDDVWKVWKVV